MMVWEYFKSRAGFDRLFILLRDKYISLGRYSGTVVLDNVSLVESEDLSNFFGYRVNVGFSFKTSFKEITNKLLESKYADFSWDELFLNYFGYKVVCKREKKAKFSLDEEAFYEGVMKEIPSSLCILLKDILDDKGNIYQAFLKRYKKDSMAFKLDLINIFKLIYHLPSDTPISLVMLSSLSGNPHFLDMDKANFRLFISILAFKDGKDVPNSNDLRVQFLAEYGIYIDMLSNFVITYNLSSSSTLVSSFCDLKEPLNLNLHNLSKINDLSSLKKRVFVFENPSMLTSLMDMDETIVVSFGQPNIAFYRVLSLLSECGNEIYYNGDMDPEGLRIAYNICLRIPGVKLFGYTHKCFMNALSNKVISESRLKMLDGVLNEDLSLVKDLLYKYKKASYQERNIDYIREFIDNLK